MRVLAVIAARGGSKRIPRKNVRPFAGRPILAWPIAAALDSGLFDTVMVSTDDDEIAAAARAVGAEVPFLRSSATADDHSTLLDVLAEVVTAYQTRGQSFDTVCCLLATAAFVTPEALKRGHQLYKSGEFDSVFPVVRFGSPIQRALRRDAAGHTAMLAPEHYASRSQDLEPAYHDAGQFYWMSAAACLAKTPTFSGRAGSFEVDETEVQDIDTPTDWRLAELKFAILGRAPEPRA
ncbi:pseudaminic acid cytidylyltransferase [uncultured Brevundimonas sp.]|uniref:pseudaminic acid cytidylyltransferase n=1 Tax=uncultured Brevundimonas sp. TaxID=213418 RepID=UPI0030EE7678